MLLSTNTCFLLAENHSGLTESSAVTGSFTAAPGATTLCSRNASSPRLPPPDPLGPSGAAEARYTTSTVTAASGARIPVCGRTAKRPSTAGCSLNATGMVCIAFRSVSSPLACLPGSTRIITSLAGSGITKRSMPSSFFLPSSLTKAAALILVFFLPS